MTSSFAVLIPILNEEKTLDSVLDSVMALEKVNQIVVVNDGSTDRTPDLLKARLEKSGSKLRVVTHEVNQGKGAAIRSGLKAVDSTFVVIQDADKEYDIADLNRIFLRLLEGDVDVVFGSRFLKSNPNLYKTYLWGNKLLTSLINIFGGGHLTDAYTCYKAMSLKTWNKLGLKSTGFEIEAEIALKCLQSKMRVAEIPIQYNPRAFEEGKKIRGWDAVKGIMTIFRCTIGKA